MDTTGETPVEQVLGSDCGNRMQPVTIVENVSELWELPRQRRISPQKYQKSQEMDHTAG